MRKPVLAALMCSAAAAAPAAASTINGAYTFTIIEQSADQRPGFRGAPVLNDAGDAAFVDLPTGATFDTDTVSVLSRTGDRQDFTIPFATRILEVSINDAGQVAVLAGIGTAGQVDIVVIDRDTGSQTTVATSSFEFGSTAEYRDLRDVQIADTGDIALTAYTNADPNVRRILRIEPTGAITTLDADATGRTINSAPTIDDAGNIAWAIFEGPNDYVVLNDGTATATVLDPPPPAAVIAPVLNNSGQLLTQTGFGLAVSDITDSDVTDSTAQGFGFGVGGTDLNDYGQVIYGPQISGGSIELDGDVLISLGDQIEGFELRNLGTGGGMDVTQGQWLNDLGQFVFDANVIRTDGSGTQLNLVIRADPVGATPDTPILPTATTGDVNFLDYAIVNGLGLEAPIYVDPIAATVFDYSVLSGPAITSLTIPGQDLGAEDGLFEILFGGFSETLGFGETLDFTAFAGFGGGVLDFTIAGIDTGSSVAPDAPFLVGLTHAGLGEVSLRITGRSVEDPPAVPLPAAAWLLLGGLAGLAAAGRRGGRGSGAP